MLIRQEVTGRQDTRSTTRRGMQRMQRDAEGRRGTQRDAEGRRGTQRDIERFRETHRPQKIQAIQIMLQQIT